MTGLRTVLGVVVLSIAATITQAQEQSINIPPPVLTIDQDRLLSETRLGERLNTELEAQAAILAEENARIEGELIKRERELTELRPTLEPEEFQALADAFDADVQRIRSEQDDKARALTASRDQARQVFLNEAAQIISSIVRERGALVVLDRRDVFLSAESIDITDEAISRINQGTVEETEE
ncbi:MAG: OmpH family outer membrane protein [Boseongicola sp.]|nr:OmpH family outer membrane protein [Boseongicola sp.]